MADLTAKLTTIEGVKKRYNVFHLDVDEASKEPVVNKYTAKFTTYNGTAVHLDDNTTERALFRKINDEDQDDRDEDYVRKKMQSIARECLVLKALHDLPKTSVDFEANKNFHPNIVKLYGCLESSDSVYQNYIVTEFLDKSLESYSIKREISHMVTPYLIGNMHFLPYDRRAQMVANAMKGVLSGLQYIHSSGFIHGNLRLSNILVTLGSSANNNVNEFEKIKISDFSLAFSDVYLQIRAQAIFDKFPMITHRPLEALLRQLVLSVPSITDKVTVTNKADIWSCGILFYQLISRMILSDDEFGPVQDWPIAVQPNEGIFTFMNRLLGTFGTLDTLPPQDAWPLGSSVLGQLKEAVGDHCFDSGMPQMTPQVLQEVAFKSRVRNEWSSLIVAMLKYNPDVRISAADALKFDIFNKDASLTIVPPQAINDTIDVDFTDVEKKLQKKTIGSPEEVLIFDASMKSTEGFMDFLTGAPSMSSDQALNAIIDNQNTTLERWQESNGRIYSYSIRYTITKSSPLMYAWIAAKYAMGTRGQSQIVYEGINPVEKDKGKYDHVPTSALQPLLDNHVTTSMLFYKKEGRYVISYNAYNNTDDFKWAQREYEKLPANRKFIVINNGV